MTKILTSFLCAFSVLAVFSGNIPFSAYAEQEENVTCEEISEMEFFLEDAVMPELYLPAKPDILSNYSETSYNYRDYLDKNNLAVYNAMSVLTTPSTDKITVQLPEKVTIQLDHMPGESDYTEEDEAIFSNGVFTACKSGVDAVLFDMPEIFWLDESRFSISIGQSSVTREFKTRKYIITIKSLIFQPEYLEAFGSLENAVEYKSMLEQAVADFEVEGETRYEQLKSIHDTICYSTVYDESADFCSSAVGTLLGNGSVCEGYAKTFKLICDRLDIPCVLAIGNFDLETLVAHMWNYVQMEDGKWYAVDVTWDDLNGKYGFELKYDYFLKGSDSFNVKHTPENQYNGSYIAYPEISADDYIIPTVSYEYGDLNHDGEVSIADLVYCSEAVTGRITPEFSCDVNGDGLADSFDVVIMRQLVISL